MNVEIKKRKNFILGRLLLIFIGFPFALMPVLPFLLFDAALERIEGKALFRLVLSLILMTPILLYAIAKAIREIYVLPTSVFIDNELKFLTIKSLSYNKTIDLREVAYYTRTSQQTGGKYRSRMYRGACLYLKSGKRYLLSEISLSDIAPINDLLAKERIRYSGKESYSIFKRSSSNIKVKRKL